MRFLIISFFVFSLVTIGGGWRAIPANQAMYALRSKSTGLDLPEETDNTGDSEMARDQLNQIYKFGWCTADAATKPYFRRAVNLTMPTWQETQLTYIYLLEKKHTQMFSLQCIIMKGYVPLKFLFMKSRLPIYYCQGIVFVLMLNTIHRYEIHEFYFHTKVGIPINFVFEFYHPTRL